MQRAPDEVALAKALSHPLRFRLLRHYNERVTSPSEIAREIGARLGDVTYHTRVLRDLGCVELVRTAQRRGATEHFYRATVRPWFGDAEAAGISGEALSEIVTGVTRDIWVDVQEAADAGRLARPDVHVSRTVLRLDDEGWKELSRRLDELLEHALRVEAESTERLARGGEPRASELAMLHFARPPDAG